MAGTWTQEENFKFCLLSIWIVVYILSWPGPDQSVQIVVFAENIKINHQVQNKIILIQDNYLSDS